MSGPKAHTLAVATLHMHATHAAAKLLRKQYVRLLRMLPKQRTPVGYIIWNHMYATLRIWMLRLLPKCHTPATLGYIIWNNSYVRYLCYARHATKSCLNMPYATLPLATGAA